MAEATAREIGQVSLVEALELTLLIAQKEPRHPRVAARWLLRHLEEHAEALAEALLPVLKEDRKVIVQFPKTVTMRPTPTENVVRERGSDGFVVRTETRPVE